jgi:hypothetical protein
MPLRYPIARLAPCLLLLVALFALSACSRVGLAYRNLDFLIPWSLSDYLSMSDAQRSNFDTQLDEHLRWHCTEELPRYRQWIASLQRMTARPRIDETELATRFDEARSAIDEIARRITPSTVQMLRDLDDQQVSELAQALDDDIAERRKKYVDIPLPKQIRLRAERMEKRLATWYGPLTRSQKERVQAWSQALGSNNSQWIENRALWQSKLKAALAQRQAPDFDQRIADLLQRRQQQWTPEYQQIFADAEVAARNMLLDIHHSASDKQRQHLQTRLQGLHEDFARIQCKPPAQ